MVSNCVSSGQVCCCESQERLRFVDTTGVHPFVLVSFDGMLRAPCRLSHRKEGTKRNKDASQQIGTIINADHRVPTHY